MLFLGFGVSTLAESPLPNWQYWQGSKLEGTRGEPLPYRAEGIFSETKWREPVSMTPIPRADHHYLVFEQVGQLWVLQPDGARKPFMKVTGRCINAIFHRDFPKIPEVLVRYSSKGINRLIRYTVSTDNGYTADPKSATPILEWPSRGHRGGDMAFGPDGYLYVAAGDGQKWGDPFNVAQNTDTLLASILRIDIDNPTKDQPYRIPKDNPFIGIDGVRPEIWAYGVRNPWRFTFRPGTNELWIGDNGDENWEMVLRTTKGVNHGWSRFEGNHIFRPNNQLKGPTKVHTPPVVEHNHREMRSVIGGRWYRGKQFPELRDHYLYGCHVTRMLWAFTMKNGSPTKPRQIADVGGQIVSFAEDPSGELLIVTLDNGIFALKRAEATSNRPVPKRLSETGLFANVANHQVASGLLPYEINLGSYRDGATAERFIGIPKGDPVHIRHAHRKASLLPPLRTRIGLDRWTFDTGTTIIQTLSLPGRNGKPVRVETQVSLNDAGVWRFLSYRWNDDQSDAELVPYEGAQLEVPIANNKTQSWRIPSRMECTACHTHVSGFVPGINLAQLNRDFDYAPLGGKKTNQIAMLRDLGFLKKGYRPPAKDVTIPKPDDESASLEDRARGYLHVNCAHCHRETGLGGRADFHLLGWMRNQETKMINALPLVGLPGGDPDKIRLIVPGHPEHSDVYRRMATAGGGRMPLFGTSTVDKEGAALIAKWIKSLKK
jgi:glucose/arabinose dehydrogenase/mono/diheme cytochrome c family protein